MRLLLLFPLWACAQPFSPNWQAFAHQPSTTGTVAQIDSLLFDCSGYLWGTAHSTSAPHGVWKSGDAGTAISPSTTTFTQMLTTGAAGKLGLNSSCSSGTKEIVANGSDTVSGGSLYRFVGNAAPPQANTPSRAWISLAVDQSNYNIYVLGRPCSDGLVVSTDGGTTYADVSPAFPLGSGVCLTATYDTNAIYIGTESQGIRKLSGGAWSTYADTTQWPGANQVLAFMPDGSVWGGDGNNNPRKRNSSTGNFTVVKVNSDQTILTRVRAFVAVGSGCSTSPFTTNCTWYLSGKNYSPNNVGPEVWFSTDLGATWATFQTGLPTETTGSDGISLIYNSTDGYLYLGVDGDATTSGVYRTQVQTVASAGGSAVGGKMTVGGSAVMR